MMEQLRMEEEPLAELMAGLSLEPSHVERKELNGAISLAPRPLAPPPRPADPPAGCGWLLHYCTKYCEWYYWHVEQRICLWRWVRTATGLTLRDAATLPIV